MLLRYLTSAAALAGLTLADVQFITPAAGSTFSSGTAMSITWKDSGSAPSISDLKSYTIQLMGGSNDVNFVVTVINPNGLFSAGNAAQGTLPTTGCGSYQNAFFLQMTSTDVDGNQIINYSDRFSITGLTDAWPANVQAALSDITGTSGPDAQSVEAVVPSGAVASGSYAIPYTQQTGAIFYCPMQPVPPTKITAKDQSRLFPTSGYTVAKTYLPTPEQKTTMTMSQTFSVQSQVNTVAAAPMPQDDMAKFLARWKD